MKKQLLLLAFVACTFSAAAQSILLVDDNDYITDNSDTLIMNLSETTYSTFDVWNVVSYGATPSSTDLENYDLVIWYASTDGAGLGFWNAGAGGDSELITYLVDGGRAWIIGSDILYAGGYDAPELFSTGDFTYDFMGLTSYDAQSYGDDGNTGVSEMYASDAPAYFADTLQWIFPTFWWADGVITRPGTHDMYTMGPVNYPLYMSVSMTHYRDANTNVMSTFFDPALIDTPQNRIDFLESSIFYLLNFDLGVDENASGTLSIYPNPATDQVTVLSENEAPQPFSLHASNGKLVQTGTLVHGENTIALDKLNNGMYFLHSDNAVLKLIKN